METFDEVSCLEQATFAPCAYDLIIAPFCHPLFKVSMFLSGQEAILAADGKQ
jgi:hypothetical protein